MKILMITYNPTHHGTFLRAFYFAQELNNHNHSVTILTTAPNRKFGIKKWDQDGIRIVEFPALFSISGRSGWDPLTILTRLNWLRDKKQTFDIVYGFESRPTVIYPAMYLKKKNIPLVLDWCDWFGKGGSVEARNNPLLKSFLRPFETFHEEHFRTKSDATTVICTTLYQRSIDLGVDPKTILLIPNGFNMPGWQPFSKDEARERFGYSGGDFVIGYVGSLFPKDADLMMRAFKKVQDNIPNAHLLHLGRSNYNVNAENQAIKITGNIDEKTLQMGLAACDICWLPLSDIPANWGRFPLKFSLYLTAGKPVLATNVGDIANFIRSFSLGNVCEPTANGIANAAIELATDAITLKYYSQNSYKLSRNNNFSWNKITELILAKFLRITQNKHTN